MIDKPDNIVEFLEEHVDYTTHELASKTGFSVSAIRNWRRQYGFGVPSKFNTERKYETKVIPFVETNRAVWDNKDWLRIHYIDKCLSIAMLSRITGANPGSISYKLDKYNIKRRNLLSSVKSSNECHDKMWLMKHYADRMHYLEWCDFEGTDPDESGGKGLSLRECAKLAGVTHNTIYNWLAKFNIEIRDLCESVIGDKNGQHHSRNPESTKNFERLRRRKKR